MYGTHQSQATGTRLPPVGSVVRLGGLSSVQELNGAIGTVLGPMKDNGRLPVRLLSPPAAVAGWPGGVWAWPNNLTELPPGTVAAVYLHGSVILPACTDVFAYQSNGTAQVVRGLRTAAATGNLPAGWQRCEVATMLGLPLALLELTPWSEPVPGGRSIAVYLLVDPVSASVFVWLWVQGLGSVLVARTDGLHFTTEEMAQLDDYNMHLMDLWSEFTDDARRKALTKQAFRSFVRSEAADATLRTERLAALAAYRATGGSGCEDRVLSSHFVWTKDQRGMR
ncbi:hypothetical protein VOLCADRAFT_88577 [Volvox carteri f. nagariensis]|uniref:Uncharacterized protein n=1 Tax=Volvox carteri f. nagariensis TaxID=3068 RepID=D8TPD3_VOLCA|nr:uncharacterized protein VOLCADRAFT_88577 [Volvox carteri f. nagariensis]EFJ50743.1 hypothetical protein VOLCADRAFT_88577 [Volvox carteri f. nagariensis]|eukprot:XP_002948336.1 hypothetical protein VOLCADRAFT_88577 [Volvox carteri f. nagariensis]